MKFKNLESHVADAESLVAKYGHLPHCTWLRKNGYQALYQMTRLYPSEFSHFPRPERTYRRLKDWVEVAQALARNNQGRIPTVSWLLENGYGMLCRQMQKSPDAFLIKQERHFNRPEDWVKIAESLAKEHGGLPNCYWLQRVGGYKALDKAMRQNPELFAHIKRQLPKGFEPSTAPLNKRFLELLQEPEPAGGGSGGCNSFCNGKPLLGPRK